MGVGGRERSPSCLVDGKHSGAVPPNIRSCVAGVLGYDFAPQYVDFQPSTQSRSETTGFSLRGQHPLRTKDPTSWDPPPPAALIRAAHVEKVAPQAHK